MKEDITLSDFCMISYTGKRWTEEWRNGGNEKTNRERERERDCGRDLREGRRKCPE